mmetsp:Transcript_118020/g.314028  ORF Transcript_118020/g.314028 Transcript_118020/m.314028 type:complete len:217 (+) Transcript_118020:422-1072(+)
MDPPDYDLRARDLSGRDEELRRCRPLHRPDRRHLGGPEHGGRDRRGHRERLRRAQPGPDLPGDGPQPRGGGPEGVELAQVCGRRGAPRVAPRDARRQGGGARDGRHRRLHAPGHSAKGEQIHRHRPQQARYGRLDGRCCGQARGGHRAPWHAAEPVASRPGGSQGHRRHRSLLASLLGIRRPEPYKGAGHKTGGHQRSCPLHQAPHDSQAVDPVRC